MKAAVGAAMPRCQKGRSSQTTLQLGTLKTSRTLKKPWPPLASVALLQRQRVSGVENWNELSAPIPSSHDQDLIVEPTVELLCELERCRDDSTDEAGGNSM